MKTLRRMPWTLSFLLAVGRVRGRRARPRRNPCSASRPARTASSRTGRRSSTTSAASTPLPTASRRGGRAARRRTAPSWSRSSRRRRTWRAWTRSGARTCAWPTRAASSAEEAERLIATREDDRGRQPRHPLRRGGGHADGHGDGLRPGLRRHGGGRARSSRTRSWSCSRRTTRTGPSA